MSPDRKKLWMFALAACLVALMQDAGRGFSYFSYNGVPVVWTGNESIRYLSPATFPPGSDAETAILVSIGLWNIIPDTNFAFSYIPLEQDFPIDHFDGFNDTIAVPHEQLDEGVLGITFMVRSGGNWFDMDVLFSANPVGAGYTLDPYPGCDVVAEPAPTNGFSFFLVATHEMGHALGLGHDPIGDEPSGTPWFIATMNPAYPGGGPVGQENIIELHTDDRNGLRFLYPPAGPGAVRPDLALAGYATSNQPGITLPLSFTPSVAYPGDEILARSIIENFGSTRELGVRQGFYLSSDPFIDVGDELLGALEWDLVFQDAVEFDVITELPADYAAGTYYFGSIIDDLNEVAEEWEDNNAASYCEPLTIGQLPPQIEPLGQDTAVCSRLYVSPVPIVALPINTAPLIWSLDAAPDGMIIHASTGVLGWDQPVPSSFPHAIIVRATNLAGSDTASFFLAVESVAPEVAGVADVAVSCQPYVGPTPQLTLAECMNPILLWTLDIGPPGMTIDDATGVVTWLEPIPSETPYSVTIRAINTAGTDAENWQLRIVGGDLNNDAAVDLADLSAFSSCVTGPTGGLLANCGCGDTDADDDVDLVDYSFLQRTVSD